jgi:circadian clock protein KaiC
MPLDPLVKLPTGIQGLDERTGGGLPPGRPSRVCGGPACGRALRGFEFLIGGTLVGRPLANAQADRD